MCDKKQDGILEEGYITKGDMNKLAKNLTKDQIDKVMVDYGLFMII